MQSPTSRLDQPGQDRKRKREVLQKQRSDVSPRELQSVVKRVSMCFDDEVITKTRNSLNLNPLSHNQ